jgi:hypothetical protein
VCQWNEKAKTEVQRGHTTHHGACACVKVDGVAQSVELGRLAPTPRPPAPAAPAAASTAAPTAAQPVPPAAPVYPSHHAGIRNPLLACRRVLLCREAPPQKYTPLASTFIPSTAPDRGFSRRQAPYPNKKNWTRPSTYFGFDRREEAADHSTPPIWTGGAVGVGRFAELDSHPVGRGRAPAPIRPPAPSSPPPIPAAVPGFTPSTKAVAQAQKDAKYAASSLQCVFYDPYSDLTLTFTHHAGCVLQPTTLSECGRCVILRRFDDVASAITYLQNALALLTRPS